LAATDEKNLPAAQSKTHPQTRFSGTDGLARGTQRTAPPPRQGAQAPGHHDSAEAAGLSARAKHGFSAADRLHKSAEFLGVQRNGVRWQTPHFVVYAMHRQGLDSPRLGITVSRQIGKAVVRNRLRRRIRECFRLRLRPMIPHDVAMVVIARAGAGGLETPTIEAELGAATFNLNRKL
jgi:ribonuclease P protein component